MRDAISFALAKRCLAHPKLSKRDQNYRTDRTLPKPVIPCNGRFDKKNEIGTNCPLDWVRRRFWMNIPLDRSYRLVVRGGSGLACDKDGATLDPVDLARVDAASACRQGRPSNRRLPHREHAPPVAESELDAGGLAS